MTTLRKDDQPTAMRESVTPYAEVRETHSGVVFFVGERAYKLKKPVDLGFLDFRTRIARAADLQRRGTPQPAACARRVPRGGDVNDVDGSPLDHLVVMRRMPEDRRLAQPRSGRRSAMPSGRWRTSGRVPLRCSSGRPRRMSPPVRQRPEDDGPPTPGDARLRPGCFGRRDRSLRYDETVPLATWPDGRPVRGRPPGRVVDGHGDLLAEDIFCLADGPRMLDCIEFDDRCVRRRPGRRGVPGHGPGASRPRRGRAEPFGRYCLAARDPPRPRVHHFVAYRAFVRAKVACLPGAVDHGRHLASMLLGLACRHLDDARVRLLVVGGSPGTGKTTVSAALAESLDAVVLSSDAVRKELAGVDAEAPMPAAYRAGIYSPEWSARTYDELLARAECRAGDGSLRDPGRHLGECRAARVGRTPSPNGLSAT